MSLSIPRRYPARIGPRGERKQRCDACGIMYLRSTMRRMPNGMLWCEDETGRDEVTLDRLNAAGAAQVRGNRPPPERW